MRRGFARRGRSPSNGRRYERGNIWLEQDITIQNTSDNTTNVAVELASVFNSVDVSIPEGRARMSAMKGIEVGGLVLDIGFEIGSVSIDLTASDVQNALWMTTYLVSDRVANNSAPVCAAGYDYYEPSVPFLDPTGSSSGQTEDFDMPTQIHWMQTSRMDFTQILLTDPVEGALHAVNDQRVHARRDAKLNKKLRLFLDDQHGLYLVFSLHTGAAWAIGVTYGVKAWLHGSVYWRNVS